jgi:hypothetical protein
MCERTSRRQKRFDHRWNPAEEHTLHEALIAYEEHTLHEAPRAYEEHTRTHHDRLSHSVNGGAAADGDVLLKGLA